MDLSILNWKALSAYLVKEFYMGSPRALYFSLTLLLHKMIFQTVYPSKIAQQAKILIIELVSHPEPGNFSGFQPRTQEFFWVPTRNLEIFRVPTWNLEIFLGFRLDLGKIS